MLGGLDDLQADLALGIVSDGSKGVVSGGAVGPNGGVVCRLVSRGERNGPGRSRGRVIFSSNTEAHAAAA